MAHFRFALYSTTYRSVVKGGCQGDIAIIDRSQEDLLDACNFSGCIRILKKKEVLNKHLGLLHSLTYRRSASNINRSCLAIYAPIRSIVVSLAPLKFSPYTCYKRFCYTNKIIC